MHSVFETLHIFHVEEGLKVAKRWTEALFHGNAQILCELSQAEMSELFRNASTSQIFLEPGMTVLDTCMKANCFGRIGKSVFTIFLFSWDFPVDILCCLFELV